MGLLVAGVLAAAAAVALHQLAAHDLWWQLASGRWILDHGWPRTDPFSYAFPTREWIEPRWLYCVSIWLVFHAAGANALILLRLLLVLATFGLLLAAPVAAGRRWAATVGAAAALLLVDTRLDLRPELVSFLLLAANLHLLERWRVDRRARWLAPLPALQLVWVNSHSLFPLGPIVQGLYLAGEVTTGFGARRDRGERPPWLPLAATVLVSTLLALANPWGWRGAVFPFRLFGELQSQHALASLIDEFRSPFDRGGTPYFTISWLTVAAISGASLLLPRRFPSARALVWAAFFYLSCLAIRNVALFGIVAGSVLALDLAAAGADRPGIAERIRRLGIASVSAIVLVLIPAAVSDRFFLATDTAKHFGFGITPNRFPIRALAFVRAEGLPTPVLHRLGDGGYVLFEGGPGSVYADGRLEVYGSEAIERAARLGSGGIGFHEEAVRCGIWTAVVEHGVRQDWIAALEHHPSWAPVYFDSTHVVYLRVGPPTEALVRRLRIDWSRDEPRAVATPPELAAPDWLAGLRPRREDPRGARALGRLFFQVGQIARGVEQMRLALRISPGDVEARLHLGLALEALGETAEARRLLDGLPRDLLDGAETLRFSGSLFEMAGHPAEALDRYRRAAGAPPTPASQRALARAAVAAGATSTALEAFEWLTRRDPTDVEAWNNRGVLLLRGGRVAEALDCFRESVRLRPDQALVWNQIGVVEVQRGDAAKARDAFERAVRLDPAYELAADNLKHLEDLTAARASP